MATLAAVQTAQIVIIQNSLNPNMYSAKIVPHCLR